ncbi:MAG: CD1871A family CXXC motif-containing protein [Desulfobulbaceae bacterium]
MRKKFSPRKGPFALLALFLLLFLAGIALGEPTRVLEQAWSICLSCIGIG